MNTKDWYYDERKQTGTDYTDAARVEAYDTLMSVIRDTAGELGEVIRALELQQDHTVIEFGCGTGELAIGLSGRCERIIAADVSVPMLEYAEKKARLRGISNITFINEGFLTYRHPGPPADGIVSQAALHHLPDFWKMVALRKANAMLKDGGVFYLRDIVYSLNIDKFDESISYWIHDIGEKAGEVAAREATAHVREEYSTLDWIMEEMLYRAGFHLEAADYRDRFTAAYVCRKISGKKR